MAGSRIRFRASSSSDPPLLPRTPNRGRKKTLNGTVNQNFIVSYFQTPLPWWAPSGKTLSARCQSHWLSPLGQTTSWRHVRRPGFHSAFQKVFIKCLSLNFPSSSFQRPSPFWFTHNAPVQEVFAKSRMSWGVWGIHVLGEKVSKGVGSFILIFHQKIR